MKILNTIIKITAALAMTTLLGSCKKNRAVDPTEGLDKLVIVTNVEEPHFINSYVGTFKDLSVGSITIAKLRESYGASQVTVYKNDVFVMQGSSGDFISKFTRQKDGTMAEAGKLRTPLSSCPVSTVIESDTRGYTSLIRSGKILVFNPTTMETISTIDLTGYGLGGDDNPDPCALAFRGGKLYVACIQTRSSTSYISRVPAQVLIIDVKKITSKLHRLLTVAAHGPVTSRSKSRFSSTKWAIYTYSVMPPTASLGDRGRSVASYASRRARIPLIPRISSM